VAQPIRDRSRQTVPSGSRSAESSNLPYSSFSTFAGRAVTALTSGLAAGARKQAGRRHRHATDRRDRDRLNHAADQRDRRPHCLRPRSRAPAPRLAARSAVPRRCATSPTASSSASVRHRPNDPPFFAATGWASFALSRRHFDGDLLTSRMADSHARFSGVPVFSGALYFADLVQSLKSVNCQALRKRRIRSRTRSATATHDSQPRLNDRSHRDGRSIAGM
jgi:hypothetical protein